MNNLSKLLLGAAVLGVIIAVCIIVLCNEDEVTQVDAAYQNYAHGHYMQQAGDDLYYLSGNTLYRAKSDGSSAELVLTEETENPGRYPSRLWSAGDKLVYLAGSDGFAARMYDPATGEATWLPFSASDTFFTHSGKVYFTEQLGSALRCYDPETGGTTDICELTGIPSNIAPLEEGIAYIPSGANAIRLIGYDGVQKQAVETSGVPSMLCADESYFCWYQDGLIYLYDRKSGDTTSHDPGAVGIGMFLCLFDGRVYYSPADSGEVWALGAAHGETECVYSGASALELNEKLMLVRSSDQSSLIISR